MVGGRVFPIQLPFEFLQNYLTGTEPKNGDLGKLLEETLLWFAMSTSKVFVGCPHAELKVPIEFHEIDMLLYESSGNLATIEQEPNEGWNSYLSTRSVCLIELTIGHQPDLEKASDAGFETVRKSTLGKDVPKNKLINFQALRSFGFKSVRGHYFSITGEDRLSGAATRALRHTEGFEYRCMAQEMNDDIQHIVLGFKDAVIPEQQIRSWHQRLIDWVENAGGSRGYCSNCLAL
jgi:hypothetical protein